MRQTRIRIGAIVGVMVLALTVPAGAGELPDRALTLEDCLALASRHNPSLVLAHQEVVAAAARVQQVQSSYLPSVTLNATRGRTGGTSFLETTTGPVAFSAGGEQRDSDLLLTQTLWQLGRKESVRGSRLSREASQAREAQAWQDLAQVVSQQYYAALAAEQLVGVAEATLAAAQDHEKLVKARVEVGEGARVDVAPAEADVADAEYQVLQAQNQAGLAKAQLKQGMGVTPTYQVRLAAPELSEDGGAIPSLAGGLELARANRPELQATEHALAASEQNVRLAKLLRYGTLAFTARFDRGLTGVQEDADSWAALLSLTMFLFEGGGREADITSARAGAVSAQAQQKQIGDSIGLEVESALLNLDTARKSVQAAGKSQTAAEEQLRTAEVKYREGVGIFVEILDAQKAVARARTNYVQARYNYQTALVNLRRATGQLASPPEQTP